MKRLKYLAVLAICLCPAPAAALSLEEALRLALAGNPELAAYRYQAARLGSEKRAVSLPPDPKAELTFDEMGGRGDARAALWLKTLVPLNGQRGHAIEAAAQRERLAVQEALAKENEISNRVKSAYHHLLIARQRLTLFEESLELAKELKRIAAIRYQAQLGSEMDLLRAEAELETGRVQAENSRANIQMARLELLAAIGGKYSAESADFSVLPASPPLLPSLESLLRRLDNESPGLRAAEANSRAAEAEASQVAARSIPEPEIGVGFVRRIELQDNLLSASIGWPLSLFGRNEEEARQSRFSAEKAAAEERSQRNASAFKLRRLYASALSSGELVKLYEKKLIPTAKEAFKRASLSFRYGRSSILDATDARRRLNEAKNGLLDARESLAFAACQLDSLSFSEENR